MKWCTKCHSQLNEQGDHYQLTHCVRRELELLREIHQRSRQLMRYNGIDLERATAAYDELKEATHVVTDFYKKVD
ncbi:MAG: hypothetical protein COA47_10190 [Robiginitomaculum sp.]|nr:MAG: hypothetical protein COA47_10190 [Robiginitomaculum sp.]